MPVITLTNLNNIRIDGSNSGGVETFWDNFPELRPPTATDLPDALFAWFEANLDNVSWDFAEATLYKDRIEALGGGGILAIPPEILAKMPPENP